MDLTRFRDLYAAEAQDQLDRLDRALLALEADGSGLAEAFRAAHTLKGLAGTMGHTAVAGIAHRLEDGLDAIRRGSGAGAAEVDALFELRDALAAQAFDDLPPEVGQAGRGGRDGGATAGTAVRARNRAVIMRADALAVRVVLAADAPIKAARAMLVARAAAGVTTLMAVDPAQPDDAFDGELILYVDPGAARPALEQAIRSAGDVELVEYEAAADTPSDAAVSPAPGSPASPHVAGARGAHVRVEQKRLDELADALGELAVLQGRLASLSAGVDASVTGMIDQMSRLVADLHVEILALRMVPVGEVLDRLPRLVRDTARQLGKDVELRIEGRDIRLDRAILNEIAEPLVHLVRNAVDHGIETPAVRAAAGKPRRGIVSVGVERERSSVRIELRDDGAGAHRGRIAARARAAGLLDAGHDLADDDLLRVLSHPGLSTAEQLSDVSGRGVGLDVVVTKVRALGGAIDMHSERGAGTTFTIRLPITLALAQALRVLVGGEEYAIPLTHVTEAVEFVDVTPERVGEREVLSIRGEAVPLVRLRTVLGATASGEESAAVLAGIGERRGALAVDRVVGHEQILVKPFDAAAGTLPHFSGVTLLADGRPALVLDPVSVL